MNVPLSEQKDTPAQPTNVPLTPEIMSALGFHSMWPSGSPTEPWWKHKLMPQLKTFMTMPTASDLLVEIQQRSFEQGQADVRYAMKKALGI